MAEKLKARAEGGRVIKDGRDVGTAAEQAGSTIPQVSTSTPPVVEPPGQFDMGGVPEDRMPRRPGYGALGGEQRKSSLPEGANNLRTSSTPGRNGPIPETPSTTQAPTTGAQAARTMPSGERTASPGNQQRWATNHGARGAGPIEASLSNEADDAFNQVTGGVASRGSSSAGNATGKAAGAAGTASVGGGGAAAGGAGRAATSARGAVGAAAGRATKGSRTNGFLRAMAYNSSFLDRELDLTTRGFVAGIGSIANDLGLNRRISAYGADGKPSSYIDTFFGTTIRGGTGYAHPLMDDAGRVTWKTAKTVQEATAGWGKHIEDSFQSSTGIMKGLTGARRSIFNALGGADGNINKMLTKLGGAGSLVAPVLMGVTAISDFREGYKKGGVFGGVASAGKGIVAGWVMNKIIAAALLNPITSLVAGGAIAAAAYSTYKIFDVRNQGNNYLRQQQMQGPSWKTGPSAGMNSAIGNTIRQRSISAMENSRFNAMRSMGNESYMINAPKSRYANSTSIHSTAPMLSY